MSYSLADVERLSRLPRATVRALVRAGLLDPARGPRGALRFSFQDLKTLRTAQALRAAGVPPRRLARALAELRQRAGSGQHLLAFQDSSAARLPPPPAALPGPAGRPQELLELALALEAEDPGAAIATYRRGIESHAACAEFHVNLGRLLHEAGALQEAAAVYEAARTHCGPDALLSFNRAVLLEDLGRIEEAAAAYREALDADPGLHDAHYNLSLLNERQGRHREALRHMAAYRRRQGA